MAAQDWNPLSYFQEMGTLPKVLLLLGFLFLGTALYRGASFSDRMVPASLVFISMSLTVHYLSESRKTVSDGHQSITVTDKGNLWRGIVLSVVTVVLVVWTTFTSTQPKAPSSASTDITKPTDVPITQKEPKDELAATPTKTTPKKSKQSTGKNHTSDSGTQAVADNSSAIGSVTQGPCSVLQSGGNNNQATGGNCGPPERHLTDSQADALANAAVLIPASQKISVESCNMPECERFADTIYAALNRKSPPSLASGPIIALVGWSGGTPPRGTVVCLHSVDSPTKPYAQPIANTLNEDKSVPTNFTSCKGLAENEIKIIIAAP